MLAQPLANKHAPPVSATRRLSGFLECVWSGLASTDPHIIWREMEVAPRTAPLQAAPSQRSPEPRRLSKELLERRSPVPAKSRKVREVRGSAKLSTHDDLLLM